jgi:transposase
MKIRKINFNSQKIILLNKINSYNYKIPFNSFYNIKFNNKISNGWFKIKEAEINKKININFSNQNFNDYIIKCKKVVILPSEKQQQILLSWFESYRKMYNNTLTVINRLIYENNKNKFNFRYIRTNEMKETKRLLTDESKINSHILDGAIKLACASYKSASSNYKNGHIKNYKIRPIKQSKKSKIMDIEKCNFSSFGFCKNSLGKIETNCNFNFNDVNSDCKLHYNKSNNRFTLLVPIKQKVNNNNNNNFISIDPGIKTFLTGISTNKVHKIGTNIIDIVKKELTDMDKLAKINNKIARKKILKKKISIKNKITDLHWKSINYLLSDCKVKNISIGNWSTKDISNKRGNLDPIYKRIANSLRYYEFLQKLQFKCAENKINLKIIDESYTSKICSFCSSLTNISTDRKLNCNCKLNLDRDINGSINILLKSLE